MSASACAACWSAWPVSEVERLPEGPCTAQQAQQCNMQGSATDLGFGSTTNRDEAIEVSLGNQQRDKQLAALSLAQPITAHHYLVFKQNHADATCFCCDFKKFLKCRVRK